jgi:MFS transporter, SHS family, lactate transporter
MIGPTDTLRQAATPPRKGSVHAVTAGFLGWTLDAFDFFVVVFLVDTLAAKFHVSKAMIVLTMTATLAMRPLGALLFGILADRYGRRIPLMVDVVFFSVVEILCGFSPNYWVFLLLRALYGIGMGGEWGVGASLTMEVAPGRLRGILSGVLQSGYSVGYLLAAVAARVLLPLSPEWGWRLMFWVGGLPALLALYIRSHVPESEAWRQNRVASIGALFRLVVKDWPNLVYLVLMMTLFMFLSHGTQDLYPDFLKSTHSISAATVSWMAILYNVGAVVGAIVFGHFSQVFGRSRGILAALALSLIMIPGWAFGSSIAVLAGSAFLLQAGVQGAWGVIPAHLNELAPAAARGLIPGFAYQLGVLFAAPTNTLELALCNWVGYARGLAVFELATILCLATVVALRRESAPQ